MQGIAGSRSQRGDRTKTGLFLEEFKLVCFESFHLSGLVLKSPMWVGS